MSKRTNLIGKRFGLLTVKEWVPGNDKEPGKWKCLCDCGKTSYVTSWRLTSGQTKSCGCYSHARFANSRIKHSESKSKLYGVWQGMKKRCYRPSYEYFNIYGGRGIKVCDSWKSNFETFRDWAIDHGYQEGKEIDRIDCNGDYSPDNCRWVDHRQNVLNRRNTLTLSHNGITKPLSMWCQEYGVNYKLAHARMSKGKTFDEIFSKQSLRKTRSI